MMYQINDTIAPTIATPHALYTSEDELSSDGCGLDPDEKVEPRPPAGEVICQVLDLEFVGFNKLYLRKS